MPRVIVVAFEGAQTLDVTGPAEVFAAASRVAVPSHGYYDVLVASRGGGEIATTSGIAMRTRDLVRLTPRRDDILLVAGGSERAIRVATGDRALLRYLQRAARIVRRVASVCSGAFLLAAAGLLDGKRATTHWSVLDELARRFPRIEVDRNAIFVADGTTWTSAGVTTGIDMSLALVEADLGTTVADAVAARLVLYARRPGFQSQWSDALVAQHVAHDPLAPVIAWARTNLAKADLETLARRAGLSPRTFHRRCLATLSTTPAKLLDKLRVERARELLVTRDAALKSLAAACGWTSTTRMTRAFERELGVTPRAYRLLHASSS